MPTRHRARARAHAALGGAVSVVVRGHRRARRLAVVLAVSAAAVVPSPALAALSYAPPVDHPVSDPYRAPSGPYAAGNRGVDYLTTPGEPVAAAADGEVTFAGQVGGQLHVVVLHADGVRTSYSFLRSVAVDRGDRVTQGDPVGEAGDGLHFGARVGEDYIDPTSLWLRPRTVHLVPTGEVRPASRAEEASWLGQALGGGLGWGRDGLAWVQGTTSEAADAAVGLVALAGERGWEEVQAQLADLWLKAEIYSSYAAQFANPAVHDLLVLAPRAAAFAAGQDACTPATEPVPDGGGAASGERILVLVGGFGSAAGSASVLDVDAAGLGYDDEHVLQFSYRGGRAPGTGSVEGIEVNDYTPADTFGDLTEAGSRLRQLLQDLRRTHPGVAVDLVAHSQGGVVARLALERTDDFDARMPRIDHVVTLGSPHHGADLATADALLGTGPGGRAVQEAITSATGGGVAADSVAAAQLREGSELLDALDDRRLPAATRVTSIAAEGDLVVPALHSALDGATNVLVPLTGATAHGDLPGSDVAHRELALALADAPPTCRGLAAGLATARGISLLEDVAGLFAGISVDALVLRPEALLVRAWP